ncbi:MAG: Type 1 glutamine amidotransferase-like domain-containing protein [Candidatus Aenigmarchaeota archaeon]|nr:Type 1 glutamine amidotransferase-like domain-containing protein [Candidatus Aenigmarchaeota archaeon]
MRIAYITTAAKGEKNHRYLRYYTGKMDSLGIDYTEIDIDGKDRSRLQSLLAETNVVYVEGGNTFYLMRSVRESGFGGLITGLVEKGMPYVGVSAGTYIACPPIEMATWKPRPDRNRYGVEDLTGLGLVPVALSVHYQPAYREHLKQGIATCRYPVRILTDGQALLFRDGKATLVGDPEEVVL